MGYYLIFLKINVSFLHQEKETKIKKALEDLRNQRQILRKNRIDKEFPVVAVVGYTNAGSYLILIFSNIKYLV